MSVGLLPAPIVLAAGASQRMGVRNKLLLPFRGRPLVAHAVEAAQKATGAAVIVVTGHERDRVVAALRGTAIRLTHNAAHETGMASSLRCGVGAAPPEAGGYLVCLGDQPGVTARALTVLCERFQETRDAEAIATFADAPGPPVLFGPAHRAALLALPDGDTGAQTLLRAHAEAVIRVAPERAGLSAEALSADIDTPEAYRRLAAHD